MELKYVRHNKVGFILWPKFCDLMHVHVGDLLCQEVGGQIISAGFAQMTGERAECWGVSESLNIASRSDDSDALTTQLEGA